MHQINLNIDLNEEKLPEKLKWEALNPNGEKEGGEIKAFLLSMYETSSNDTLKIDLWVNDFQIQEMDRFFYQTLRSLCDTYIRATKNEELGKDMMAFVKYFGEKTGLLNLDKK